MTYIVSGGALNSTHSLPACCVVLARVGSLTGLLEYLSLSTNDQRSASY